ncbi:MAG: molybdopterin-guanine dinucleotide biosynthesis protein MobB [Desulfovibrionaceae bacterium]|nr:molybdopterin-guanine dinucleotide biosynthesis protein MobB [Desulfovibrionaceae bacterium]MBF0514650.1 molybdopterin-guanine dinucleotide biosynthesis protein MobB [Desulfovibrionaceae bacterium]
MIAVNIVGFKKSGKTSLVLELAQTLTAMGVRVGAAKSTHNPKLDKENTDTDRLLAVTVGVAAVTPGEAAVFWPHKRYLADLLPLLDADVALVEGGKEYGWLPRVLLAGNAAEAEELDPGKLALASFGPYVPPGLARPGTIRELAELIMDKAFALPGLDCGGCGHDDCAGLAARIVAGSATIADCASLAGKCRVAIDGKPLPLNPFVERMLARGVRAMLAELKGYAPGVIEMKME